MRTLVSALIIGSHAWLEREPIREGRIILAGVEVSDNSDELHDSRQAGSSSLHFSQRDSAAIFAIR